MANDIKRLNYFTGQFLEAQDFKDEQQYHIEMRRRLNRLMYSPGVVENGLEIKKVSDIRISVGTGFAIDVLGRELFITALQETDVTGFDPNTVVYVALSYNESETDARSAENISGNIRITESPEIKLLKNLPAGDQFGLDIPIATLKLDANKNIESNSLDTSERLMANLKVGSKKLGIGTTTDPKFALSVAGAVSIGTNFANLAITDNSLNVEGNIIGRNLSLAADNERRGALFFTSPGLYNHAVYNNNSNVDGEGKWDGIKFNTGSGINIRTGSPQNYVSSLYITGGPLVGINTTEPKSQLSVAGGLSVGNTYAKTIAAPANGLLVEGKVGIGTPDPKSKLTVNSMIGNRNTFDFSDAQITVFEPNHNGGTIPNGQRDILHLVREGVASQAYGNKASFALGRYENDSTKSRTQLDIKLTDDSFNTHTAILSLRSNGNVGIGISSPSSKLHIDKGRVDITSSDLTGGGGNRFDGLNDRTTNGRSQLVLSSNYSDLVIASSQVNHNHGSTLTFVTYNTDNTRLSEYRKWVINQGNWGSRKQFLDFGYKDADDVKNPHECISATNTVLTLDGVNKRLGIGTSNPTGRLDIAELPQQGTGNISSSSGTTVTGLQTAFQTQLRVGDKITVGAQTRRISAISSNNALTMDSAFNPAISTATAFTYVRSVIIDDGSVRVTGSNVLELGAFNSKEASAGKIGYQTLTTDALDIVGAGTSEADRKIKLWAEKNLDIASGRVDVSGNVCIKGTLYLWSSRDGNTRWRSLGANGVSGIGVWSTYDTNPPDPSDLRLKTQLQPLVSALKKIRLLSGVSYRWNEIGLQHLTRHIESTLVAGPDASDDENRHLWQNERDNCYETLNKPQVGVIAQEVESVLPEAVSEDEAGYKQVNYKGLIPLLIEAIKELEQTVSSQAKKLQELTAMIEKA
jgi:hypothetical protein